MSWLGLNTAVSGFIGSQRKLYTTSHNVANADKPGYSRQVARQSATSPLYMSSVGYIGTGTQINLVERVRNQYVDHKFRSENSPFGEWTSKKDALKQIEHILGQSEEEGLNVNVDDFFKKLEQLSKDPGDPTGRISFRESAVSFTKQLNDMAQRLYKEQKDLNIEVGGKIKKVNELGEQIKNLNDQIFRLEIDGHPANDLRDQRDLLVDELSKIVDIKTYDDNGKFIVTIGGTTLVEHNSARKLKYPPNVVESSINPTINLYQLQWDNGEEVTLKSGELKGLIEARDGNGKGGNYNGVPYYVQKLDEFAKTFAERINEVHKKGLTLGDPPKSGINMFESNNGLEIRADNIMVSKDIMEDPNNIATADKDNGKENKKIIEELLDLRNKKDFFLGTDSASKGTPEEYLTSLISILGVDSQHAQRMADKQKTIIDNVLQKRDSISQVDPDHEMSDMVRFTQSLNAAARMITTFDNIFDVTINRFGLVGR